MYKFLLPAKRVISLPRKMIVPGWSGLSCPVILTLETRSRKASLRFSRPWGESHPTRISSTYKIKTMRQENFPLRNTPLNAQGSVGQDNNPWLSVTCLASWSHALDAHRSPFKALDAIAYVGLWMSLVADTSAGSRIATWTPGGKSACINAVLTSIAPMVQHWEATSIKRALTASVEGVAELYPRVAATPFPAAICCTTKRHLTPGLLSISLDPRTQRQAIGLIPWSWQYLSHSFLLTIFPNRTRFRASSSTRRPCIARSRSSGLFSSEKTRAGVARNTVLPPSWKLLNSVGSPIFGR